MSRVTRKEWYERVNAAWPADVPALTPIEAIRAGRKLYRFAMGRTFPAQNVKLTSGRRYSYIRRGMMFVNPTGHTAGARRGWVALVHDLSHYFDNRLNPSTKPHASAHARLELRLIKEVIRRGWLDGKLKDDPVAKVLSALKGTNEILADMTYVVRPGDAKREKRLVKHQRTLAAIDRWERKERRAANALKKLRRSLRAQERGLFGGIVTGQSATLQ